MKTYRVSYVERAGFPGAEFAEIQAKSDKALRTHPDVEACFNRSVNRGHCGIRVFRKDGKCVYHRFATGGQRP